MKIRGAVLVASCLPRPYATSRPLRVEELDLAPPGPGEVLVRAEVAGVCHSDLSVVDGNRLRPLPMLIGHEAAGIVEETGQGVGDVAVGQRVILTFLPRCGTCEACARGGQVPCPLGGETNAAGTLISGRRAIQRGGDKVNHHLGVSGFATHAVLDARSVVPVPDDVPADVASLLGCAVLTGGGAVLNAGRPAEGATVMVIGLGGVGMAALMTAVGLGGRTVIGVDAVAAKRELALELGADEVLSPEQAAARPASADVVVEAVGRAAAFETAVAATATGGTAVTVALPAPDDLARISPLDLVARGRTVVGSYLGSAVPPRDIPVFVEMWRQGRLPVERLISATIPLDEVNEAMDQLADGTALRQLVRP